MMDPSGRVPLRIRVGVTGHRSLVDEAAIASQFDVVARRIEGLLPSTPTTPALLEVVSPLSEGSDRLVAARLLEIRSAILETPLPLDPADYESDFASEASRVAFAKLLERSDRVWTVGGSDRLDAYRRTGEYVVDSCDVLVAIWDGEPARGTGGTAEILKIAEDREMPTFLIDATPPFDVHERCIDRFPGTVAELEAFNMASIPERWDARSVARSSDPSSPEGQALERCVSWIHPVFRRADLQANRKRRGFVTASRGLLVVSALAVAAGAVSVVWDEDGVGESFAFLEVALMVLGLVTWLMVRRRVHVRWVTARFLTERLRSATFLAFAASAVFVEPAPEGFYRGNAQEWLTRTFREIWRTRPSAAGPADLEATKVATILRDSWLDPQARYYERRAKTHERAARTLLTGGILLFLGTIAAACIHAFRWAEGSASDVAKVLSLALPALGGALAGIAGLEQHNRHAEQFALMARRVQDLSCRLARATDMEIVRDLALRTEAELRSEGDAWIDVMRQQDVELPA